MTAIETADFLFKCHHHAKVNGRETVVYKEQDVIKLIKLLGGPEPDWEGNASRIIEEATNPKND